MEENEAQGRPGVDRRTLIRRSAIAGGAMVWAVPTVQTLAGPAFAAGSPCMAKIRFIGTDPNNPTCFEVTLNPTSTCCTCINNNSSGPGGTVAGAAFCFLAGSCTIQSTAVC